MCRMLMLAILATAAAFVPSRSTTRTFRAVAPRAAVNDHANNDASPANLNGSHSSLWSAQRWAAALLVGAQLSILAPGVPAAQAGVCDFAPTSDLCEKEKANAPAPAPEAAPLSKEELAAQAKAEKKAEADAAKAAKAAAKPASADAAAKAEKKAADAKAKAAETTIARNVIFNLAR